MAGLRRLGSSTRCLGLKCGVTPRCFCLDFQLERFEDFTEKKLREGGRVAQPSQLKRDNIYQKTDWQDSSRVFVMHLIERMRYNQNIQGVKGVEVGKAVELRCFLLRCVKHWPRVLKCCDKNLELCRLR